jgi:hypothetical protein
MYADSKNALAFSSRDGAGDTCGASITTGTGGPDDNNFDTFDPFTGVTRHAHPTDCWDGLGVLADGEDFTEFVTVRFNESVFIDMIDIGENRGVGSVISVEAYDYDTLTWMVMWSGEADLELYNYHKDMGLYHTFRPELCQPPFKTDVIKIKMDTKTIQDWVSALAKRAH